MHPPNPEPSSTSLPTLSLWFVPEHRLWVTYFMHRTHTGHLFYLMQISWAYFRDGSLHSHSFKKSLMRSPCCIMLGIWKKFLLNSFFFFLNLRLNGDKMIHNMSKLLKFLLSSSGPKPQRIIAKLPLESQGSWWSWFTEHPGRGMKFFLKRSCGNHSWASWDSNWCLFSPVFLRLNKEKSNLDTKEKAKPKVLCFLMHYKSKFSFKEEI